MGNKEKNPSVKKCQFSDFRAEIFFSSWREKVMSRAKPSKARPSRAKLKTLQLELWLEPAWLRLITSDYQFREPEVEFRFFKK